MSANYFSWIARAPCRAAGHGGGDVHGGRAYRHRGPSRYGLRELEAWTRGGGACRRHDGGTARRAHAQTRSARLAKLAWHAHQRYSKGGAWPRPQPQAARCRTSTSTGSRHTKHELRATLGSRQRSRAAAPAQLVRTGVSRCLCSPHVCGLVRAAAASRYAAPASSRCRHAHAKLVSDTHNGFDTNQQARAADRRPRVEDESNRSEERRRTAPRMMQRPVAVSGGSLQVRHSRGRGRLCGPPRALSFVKRSHQLALHA
jgi:hypothetical protein